MQRPEPQCRSGLRVSVAIAFLYSIFFDYLAAISPIICLCKCASFFYTAAGFLFLLKDFLMADSSRIHVSLNCCLNYLFGRFVVLRYHASV